MQTYSKDDLINFTPRFDALVGIDSDGCVFDTMEVKQKEHFHPLILEHWGLGAIEVQVRAAAEFVNLYSTWRGSNRFPALLKTFELLHDWPEAHVDGVTLPEVAALRAYVESGLPLGNPSLMAECERRDDPDLQRVLDWSLAVNKSIDDHMDAVPPFPSVRSCLERMGASSDLLVVSQTPEEALVKEWKLHGLKDLVEVIAGQELGTKAEHLAMVKGERYAPERILMVGDAPGDRKAAAAVGACFFPINPGREEDSWKRLRDEGYAKFLDGDFLGAYQDDLNHTFEALLPETPPWAT